MSRRCRLLVSFSCYYYYYIFVFNAENVNVSVCILMHLILIIILDLGPFRCKMYIWNITICPTRAHNNPKYTIRMETFRLREAEVQRK